MNILFGYWHYRLNKTAVSPAYEYQMNVKNGKYTVYRVDIADTYVNQLVFLSQSTESHSREIFCYFRWRIVLMRWK